MTRPSTKFVEIVYNPFGTSSFVAVDEEVAPLLRAEGHEPKFITLTHHLNDEVFHIDVFCSKCKTLINPDSRIKKCINKRPGSKLKKSPGPKGKK